MKKNLLFISVAILTLVLGYLVGSQLGPKRDGQLLKTERATVLRPPKPLIDFTLTESAGNAFTLESLRKKWTLMFFGYANCPDVCPTSLSILAKAYQLMLARLKSEADIQVVFVSVDPERDTPEQLAQYVAFFNKDFIGVTGTKPQLDNLTKQLGILYMKQEGKTAGSYLVDHTAAILLINPEAGLHALFSAPHDADAIAADTLKIRNHQR